MSESALPPATTVLVVDDQPQLLSLLQDFLTDCGFLVLAAPNGSAAEQVAANHADAIDLLITDIDMPDGDGLSLAQKLRIQRPAMAIIYMSGNLKVLRQSSIEITLGSIFLEKPVAFAELRTAISTLLR
ncbi:MAG TPA: response regulator [Candidatus Angelobacter sp.]|jgi:DNA-binding response OmpR family regulator|nr:response regulator [Candidatus Angelobacter sp.]